MFSDNLQSKFFVGLYLFETILLAKLSYHIILNTILLCAQKLTRELSNFVCRT